VPDNIQALQTLTCSYNAIVDEVTGLVLCSAKIGDRCYDFKNIFFKKFGEKILLIF
jgi:hypothetical protein